MMVMKINKKKHRKKFWYGIMWKEVRENGTKELEDREKRKKGQQKVQIIKVKRRRIYMYIYVTFLIFSRIFVSMCLKGVKFSPCFKHSCKKLGMEVLHLV
jgi:hypothetical protein